MSKSENILALEAALKENKELFEKFIAAKKRIVENKEADSDSEMMVKAAAEIGFTLTVAEVERVIAETQELSDEDLAKVAGGEFHLENWCWLDYNCGTFYHWY